MQFMWPFRSAYLIVYLDDNYQNTIIGVPNRRYVWIISRSHDLSEQDYQSLVDRVEDLGYDPALLQRVPHRWSAQ